MDDATRARLDEQAIGHDREPTDLRTLLAAYDDSAARLVAYRAICRRFVDGLATGRPPAYWVQLRREAAAVLEQPDE
jgi:hypothetical protein